MLKVLFQPVSYTHLDVYKRQDIIELYRNGMLLSYITPQTKDFEFRIDDGILSSDYTLKIYYKNGGIEERTVYSLSDSELLKKGRYRFSAQSGRCV